MSGTASFVDTSDGVLVTLNLRNLPDPTRSTSLTFTRALARKGRCMSAVGLMARKGTAMSTAMSGHGHGRASREHGDAKIEYPLSQVKSDSEGHGSSTTTLREISSSCSREHPSTSTSMRRAVATLPSWLVRT